MNTDAPNSFLTFSISPLPNENVINLDIAPDIAFDKMENDTTTPPTMLYMPKSSTPNTRSMTLEV